MRIALYPYALVERALASMHDAHMLSKGSTQFRATLRNLLRIGVPVGLRSSTGRKLTYETDHVYQWAFALELLEFGVDQSFCKLVIEKYWSSENSRHINIRKDFDYARKYHSPDNPLFLYISPQILTKRWNPDRDGIGYYFAFPDETPTHDTGLARRSMRLNISDIILTLDEFGIR